MTESAKRQRWARALAMTTEERDAFLAEQRTCRLATVGTNGPHVAPLWFFWRSDTLWLTSLTRSQRWTDLQRDPRVAVVVDTGENYTELRGVEFRGAVEFVGEAPRIGEDVPELTAMEQDFAAKYGLDEFTYDGLHAWMRLVPEKIVSWDFRKMRART